MSRLVLYGRPGCHLCDEARAALLALGHPFEEIDIDSDRELTLRYLERIPVVSLDGEIVCELLVDEAGLRSRLDSIGAR